MEDYKISKLIDTQKEMLRNKVRRPSNGPFTWFQNKIQIVKSAKCQGELEDVVF